MQNKEEFSIIVRDGTQLNGYEWCVEKPLAMICMIHGLGEHAGRYEHVAAFFNEQNFSFYAIDLRGHGLSEGKRGHTPSHERMLDDTEEFLMYARAEYNDAPLFLFGHSMGGNIVLNYLLRKNTNELTGALVSTPWLKTKIVTPKWQEQMAKFLVKLLPSLSQPNGLKTDWLTNDPGVNMAYATDPLVHDKISIKLYLEFVREGLWALDNTALLKIPVFIYHGENDEIASQEASKEFSDSAGELATYRLYPDTKHEPHNDLSHSQIFEDTLAWLKKLL